MQKSIIYEQARWRVWLCLVSDFSSDFLNVIEDIEEKNSPNQDESQDAVSTEITPQTAKAQTKPPEGEAVLQIELFFLENEVELFQSEMPNFLPFITLYQAKKILWDLRNFQILVEPALQEWIDTHINAAEVEAGIVQEAFLMPPDEIAQIAIEQTMDEAQGQQIKTAFFETEAAAWLWLNSTLES
ncbi:hypothetical protein [Hugenholtzia roseola]|uniref:hypothetical protein n=1 Tax=Hugenholtzia roseola TaxID=1002 RepID=UPI0003FB69C0|nr:hypothetical protein [Hugenholtzia roseola]